MNALAAIGMNGRFLLLGFLIAAQTAGTVRAVDTEPNSPPIEITVLYDNYLLCEDCRADWGFSCLIAGTEKTILFDAGAYGNILLGNMDTLQVDAEDVDLMAISHNHGDHTGDWQQAGGVLSFLARNSNVTIYLPPSVPAGPIQILKAAGARTETVNEPMEICEGVHLTGPMTGTAVEQSLVLDTPKGLVVITGCAHQGVVQAVSKAKQMLDKDVYLVLGGFHLLNMSDSQVQDIIQQFRDLGVQKAGPSHCTGPRAIELFRQAYGADFVPVGVGRISMPVECDFTGDWKVDIEDLILFIEHWGQDDPAFDIAPPLFGDGIVDVRDLEVLMSYWGQEMEDPSLIAHWALDEDQGTIAYDSAGQNDAFLVGSPAWQPDAGKVGGALAFDGADDCAFAELGLNPARGPFSVFAWVKNGVPGQVLISQLNGTNWLRADPASGCLMTELCASGRGAGPLQSEIVVTDGAWHRIGFVWDGGHRSLYVDGILVAEDTQQGLNSSVGGLNIGCGSNAAAGTFFSGLIDDVRIYNKALSAGQIEVTAR